MVFSLYLAANLVQCDKAHQLGGGFFPLTGAAVC